MIKEAIKYLKELGIRPDERFVDIVDGDGSERHFVVNEEGQAREILPIINRSERALEVNTLTGLVDYIKANLERQKQTLFLQVDDERTVYLKGTLDADGGRETLVVANSIVPSFRYDHYYTAEEMIIAFQSKFKKTEDRELLLKVIGNVKEENVRKTGDNGVSQAVTIKTGIASADDVLVPNPVTLAPYRTFLEVEQPASDFIFRMQDGPRGAIFEADGGVWRNAAISNVREYLKDELAEEIESKRITIIA
ncbi:hypothetical protein KO561_13020 [Radiobacillus kanasensis]|uniref:hypothetical protein n=1 Tax=Radiobacillus kanasensis TaxID=2844358 RepID=UPI001E5DE599|nr:hypothetical protein [Radiobacillus kanasensis]UFT98124.1 hypothetical protein KO561_13020 [Radiobacillus kanasensis]